MNIDVDINFEAVKQVWGVSDFCKRFRLDAIEEDRLKALFGDHASQIALLMNAKRRPAFR